MTKEKIQAHLSALAEKLRTLKEDAREAYMQGDDLLWVKLKKRKLQIKDEITQTEKRINA